MESSERKESIKKEVKLYRLDVTEGELIAVLSGLAVLNCMLTCDPVEGRATLKSFINLIHTGKTSQDEFQTVADRVRILSQMILNGWETE